MKVRNISSASKVISAVTFTMMIIEAVISALFREVSWFIPLVTIACATYMVFYVSKVAVRKFVIYRLKPIYQVAFGRDIRTKELETELANKPNLMEYVGNELSVWAENNRKEILRLKDNERYRREFLGNVSHEIKTPIFNIQGYISTLLDGGLTDDTINRKYLENAEKSIDRLINIVNDLEEISKLESGVLNLQFEKFNVIDLARDIIDTVEFEATERNIKIEISALAMASQSAVVRADKRYIEQVFTNLIINSIRYGNPGGRTVISFIDLFDKLMIEVQDNGIGIAKDDIPRVFERFYRTDKSRSRKQGGTGLGLAIVKHILEAHNETITLRSEVGKGSTFAFTLSKN